MKVEIRVPHFGESVSSVTIARILKENGSLVCVDEELLEIESDKANQIVFAPVAGHFYCSFKEGSSLKSGEVIGFIESDKELKQTESHSKLDRSVLEEGTVLSPIRQFVVKKFLEIQEQTAMVTTFNEVDMSLVLQYKQEYEKTYGFHFGLTAFFARAVVEALKKIPILHAYRNDDKIIYYKEYHIGIAVQTEHGLLVPVIRNCDTLSINEIEQELQLVAARAKESKITPQELRGSTFTITNGGVFGSLFSTPILNAMQSGILGMHAVQKRAVVIEDQIVIRPMMYLALTYDHCLINGKEAISFLNLVKEFIEKKLC